MYIELIDPSFLKPRSDPIQLRHLKNVARSDPIYLIKKMLRSGSIQ